MATPACRQWAVGRLGTAATVAALSILVSLSTARAVLELPKGVDGGIDIAELHPVVTAWFGGEPVYGVLDPSDHLPATYLLMWLTFGWISWPMATRVWVGVSVALLCVMSYCMVRWVRPVSKADRLMIALLPFSAASTMTSIGYGNIATFALFPLLGTVAKVAQREKGLGGDVLVAAMYVLSLCKPTMSAPFFWIVAFTRPMAAGLASLGYVALTLFAASFQEPPLGELIYVWLTDETGIGLGRSVNLSFGYVHLFRLTEYFEIEEWSLILSMMLISLAAIPMYLYRNADIWILGGCLGIFARVWTYHAVVNDQLIFFPLIALYRVAVDESYGLHVRRTAKILFAFTLLGIVAPVTLVFVPGTEFAFGAFQAAAWSADLAFLALRLQESENGEAARRIGHSAVLPGV